MPVISFPCRVIPFHRSLPRSQAFCSVPEESPLCVVAFLFLISDLTISFIRVDSPLPQTHAPPFYPFFFFLKGYCQPQFSLLPVSSLFPPCGSWVDGYLIACLVGPFFFLRSSAHLTLERTPDLCCFLDLFLPCLFSTKDIETFHFLAFLGIEIFFPSGAFLA